MVERASSAQRHRTINERANEANEKPTKSEIDVKDKTFSHFLGSLVLCAYQLVVTVSRHRERWHGKHTKGIVESPSNVKQI